MAADVKIYDSEFSEIAGPQSTDENGNTMFFLENGVFRGMAVDSIGNIGISEVFYVPDNSTVTIAIDLGSQTMVMPEFPSFLVLPLFMIATLLAVIVYSKKRNKSQEPQEPHRS